jgi:hypothetical protein
VTARCHIAVTVTGGGVDVRKAIARACSTKVQFPDLDGGIGAADVGAVAVFTEDLDDVLEGVTPRDLPSYIEIVEYPVVGECGWLSRWRPRRGWHVAQVDSHGGVVLRADRVRALLDQAENIKKARELFDRALGGVWIEPGSDVRRRKAAESIAGTVLR